MVKTSVADQLVGVDLDAAGQGMVGGPTGEGIRDALWKIGGITAT